MGYKVSCNECSGTGWKLGLPITEHPTSSGDSLIGVYATKIKCKKCDGEGVCDSERLVTVPIKFVKNEFWKL